MRSLKEIIKKYESLNLIVVIQEFSTLKNEILELISKNDLTAGNLIELLRDEDITKKNSNLIVQLTSILIDQGKEEALIIEIEIWIRQILNSKQKDYLDEYLIESLIDLWDESFQLNVPIDILEQILLTKFEGGTYGSVIKAAGLLSDYPKIEADTVIGKIKKTKRYLADSYYREWMDYD